VRDFVYVGDVVRANVAALSVPPEHPQERALDPLRSAMRGVRAVWTNYAGSPFLAPAPSDIRDAPA
jgi:nucleoside-diphosphate-sugar epimerase